MRTYNAGTPRVYDQGPGDFSGYTAPKYWHLTPSGEVKQCKAKKKCPYGDVPHTAAKNIQNAQSHFQDVIAKEQVKNINAMRLGSAYNDNAVVGARDIASRGYRLEEALDTPADAVEIIGTVQINDDHPEITIKRILTGQGLGKKVEWELSRELSNGKTYTRRLPVIDDLAGKELNTFFTGEPGIEKIARVESLSLPGYTKTQADEAYNELRYRIREIARTVENEAALSPVKGSIAHPAGNLSHLIKDEEGRVKDKINFSSSGFRPEHLRSLDVGEREISRASGFNPRDERNEYWAKLAREEIAEKTRKDLYGYRSYTGIGPEFEVYEQNAGDGAASWKMKQNEDGTWTIKLRGTRGDTKTIVTDSPEEAEAHAQSFFSKRIKRQRFLALAKRTKDMATKITPNAQDRDQASHRKNRVTFMARMIGEANLLAMRAEANSESLAQARARLESYAGSENSNSSSKTGFFGRKR